MLLEILCDRFFKRFYIVKTGLIERIKIEFHGFGFNDIDRIAGIGDFGDGDNGLALRIEDGYFVMVPSIKAIKRKGLIRVDVKGVSILLSRDGV